jgi:preprotein translocase subunit SecD
MKNFIFLICIIFSLGYATVAFGEISFHEVADDTAVIDAKRYRKFQVALNMFEPAKTIWVLRKCGLTGKDIDGASEYYMEMVEDPFAVPSKVIGKQPAIKIKFKDKARRKLEIFTAANAGKIVAIILDGEILAAPKIFEPIKGGKILISGKWTTQEVARIVNRMNEIVLPKHNTKHKVRPDGEPGRASKLEKPAPE